MPHFFHVWTNQYIESTILFFPTVALSNSKCTFADVRTVNSQGERTDQEGYLQVCQKQLNNSSLDWVLVCSNESNLPYTNDGTSHAACMQKGYAKFALTKTKSR